MTWPAPSSTSRSSSRPATATSCTLAIATSRPARTAGARASSARRSSSPSTRNGPRTSSKRSTYSLSAASPRARTSATMPATASATDAAPGAIARTAAATCAGSPSARRSTATQALHAAQPLDHLVDGRRLELVGDGVGDQPGGRGEDHLAHDEAVLAQRRARGREDGESLGEAGEPRELEGALNLDDLGLAPGVLEPARRQARVLRRD